MARELGCPLEGTKKEGQYLNAAFKCAGLAEGEEGGVGGVGGVGGAGSARGGGAAVDHAKQRFRKVQASDTPPDKFRDQLWQPIVGAGGDLKTYFPGSYYAINHMGLWTAPAGPAQGLPMPPMGPGGPMPMPMGVPVLHPFVRIR